MISTTRCPSCWNCASLVSTTTCPRWMSGAVGSMPSFTRSGSPAASCLASCPSGSTSSAPRVRMSRSVTPEPRPRRRHDLTRNSVTRPMLDCRLPPGRARRSVLAPRLTYRRRLDPDTDRAPSVATRDMTDDFDFDFDVDRGTIGVADRGPRADGERSPRERHRPGVARARIRRARRAAVPTAREATARDRTAARTAMARAGAASLPPHPPACRGRGRLAQPRRRRLRARQPLPAPRAERRSRWSAHPGRGSQLREGGPPPGLTPSELDPRPR